jgi:MoaA/NifB/PqqE/SkfB family radical SAM enzyme
VNRHGRDVTGQNLGIELTTRCNSACRHCFARAGLTRETSLTRAQARDIWAEGYDAGYRQLHLTGGEPLLWPGLFELLDEVFERGYQSVFLNTNGRLMTDEVVRRLAHYPHLTLSVSLQGSETLHDAMRGAGSYSETRQGIARALTAGLTVIIFATTGKVLLGQLPAFAAEVYDQFDGIERLTLIQLIRVQGDFFDLAGDLLAPDDFLRLVRTVSAMNLCGLKTDVLNNPLVNVVAEALALPLVPRSQMLCRPGKLIIRANGDITQAHSTWDTFGQYAPGMITKVLADDRFRAAMAPDEEICPACRHVDRCRRNGMLQPSSDALDRQVDMPYCQKVLSGVACEKGAE